MRYIPNMPVRKGWGRRLVANTIGQMWKGFKSTCSLIYGRDGHTPYLHCVRVYPLTSVHNPKMDITSLKSILSIERPLVQMEIDAELEIYTNGESTEAMVR